MLKIRIPSSITYGDVLTTCASAITGNKSLKENLLSSVDFLKTAATDYSARATNATLFQLQRSPNGNPTVIGSLQKNELIKLYEYYFCGRKDRRLLRQTSSSCKREMPVLWGHRTPSKPRPLHA